MTSCKWTPTAAHRVGSRRMSLGCGEEITHVPYHNWSIRASNAGLVDISRLNHPFPQGDGRSEATRTTQRDRVTESDQSDRHHKHTAQTLSPEEAIFCHSPGGSGARWDSFPSYVK
ncbi:methyltransferase domain-containing protein [Anopheles sinensis]|uniref:Methyltransferase domain-containing protein n=1 Tax=Anopheles sinensis TaxID=74873 RepID=A0A084VQN6_ANOSI|nr:methyltransferase domain-containing protein [Anopheles sinensis]